MPKSGSTSYSTAGCATANDPFGENELSFGCPMAFVTESAPAISTTLNQLIISKVLLLVVALSAIDLTRGSKRLQRARKCANQISSKLILIECILFGFLIAAIRHIVLLHFLPFVWPLHVQFYHCHWLAIALLPLARSCKQAYFYAHSI